jgi:hypothetical protein
MNCPTPSRSSTGCWACPRWIVGDRGYSSHAFRQHIWQAGARPAIPAKRNEEAVACPEWIYNNCNVVERLWARLKEWRALATVTRKPLPDSRRPLLHRNPRLAQATTDRRLLDSNNILRAMVWSKSAYHVRDERPQQHR